MQSIKPLFFLGLIFTIFLAGCGGYSKPTTTPGTQSATMSLSVTDAPPAGVTVFSFEVTLTGATLNGTGIYATNIDLLAGKGPQRIEVKHLETENAFLNLSNVTPGNYTTLKLTFSNPELTFRNDSAAAIAGCAPAAVCEIKPTGTLTTTVTGQFNPSAGTQTGVLLDLNLNNLLTQSLGVDFSTAGAVTATAQSMNNQGDLENLDDLEGVVASASSSQFTLQTSDMGNVTITIDGNTEFEGFDACTTANAACLINGQSVDVDLALLASGSFVARKIELHDDAAEAGDDELDGVISKIDGPAQFEIVVIDELRSVTNVSVGDPVTVMLATTGSPTSFRVDTGGLSVPSSLQQAFENSTDTSQLIPGQTVQVRKVSVSGGPAPAAITVTTDRIRLRDTRLTATVSGAPTGNNFNIATLPGLFTANGIATIQVQTSSNTGFDNVAGVSGLADGNTVSVRGLLFSSTPNPVIIADKVRKR
ncbi:MAG TPA: DUF5666 domain-containing protein [Candidatus Acidoferrum sp.]|nr:DUF5666 domain-containing protein [Candidatus Acidoferrum sp.]